MSIFSDIANKIFHHAAAQPAAQGDGSQQDSQSGAPGDQTAAPQPADTSAPAASTPVDIGAVLEQMAAMKDDHGGNYQSSIVDLLKLLDLDSSLSARKKLADELGVHEAEDGSAEQNIALHRAVMDKLEENGGIVPDSMRQ